MLGRMNPRRYLIRFSNDYFEFRQLEFDALAQHFGLEYRLIEDPQDKPFFLLETTNEVALKKVLNRSILVHAYYELWISARTFDSFYKQLGEYEEINAEYYKTCSFCVLVETYGKKVNLPYKIHRIEQLDFLPWDGPIKLKDPDATFYQFEYYGNDRLNPPEQPLEIHFGKWIADGSNHVKPFSLKERKFIANTSMEPRLAFLMSNIARVDRNDIVYDPFVGSGSLIVSAAYFGAFVFGTDIDYQLLHGLAKPSRCGEKVREKDESVLANFKQYNLESRYGDVFSGDSSQPNIRLNFEFDSIITDPPYGRREARERIGNKKKYVVPEELVAAHIPSKLEYQIEDMYRDLFDFATTNLKIGGRLVFWAPYSRVESQDIEKERAAQVPVMSFFKEHHSILDDELRARFAHDRFLFVGFAEQPLTAKYSRILIVLERVK